jgi:formylmethanofuran dehydrogenase subunit C
MKDLLLIIKGMNGWKYVGTIVIAIATSSWTSYAGLRDGQLKAVQRMEDFITTQKERDTKQDADLKELKNEIRQEFRDLKRDLNETTRSQRSK